VTRFSWCARTGGDDDTSETTLGPGGVVKANREMAVVAEAP
jgi:hypothetical protein